MRIYNEDKSQLKPIVWSGFVHFFSPKVRATFRRIQESISSVHNKFLNKKFKSLKMKYLNNSPLFLRGEPVPN